MAIVRIIGGLGNQMFQYAFYESMKERDKFCSIDISGFDDYKLHNGFEIERIFNVNPLYADEKKAKELMDCSNNIVSKIRRKLFGVKRTYYKEKYFDYDSKLFNIEEKNIYFDGYWQTEKYFKNVSNIIRENFKFKKELTDKNLDILSKILGSQSVSIHIRRGDYYSNPTAYKIYGNICEKEYYSKAINLIKSKVENPQFYIFSDDIEWAKNNLDLDNSNYIDWNKADNSYIDMQLMSNCKHNIIANSTFSWWGAWLNNNENKIVIAPNKWFNGKVTQDIIPENWMKII